jgi:hypothetical protein
LGVSRGIEGALIGFLVAGAFLSVSYYPNMWTILGLMTSTTLAADNDARFADPIPAGNGESRG